MRYKLGLLFMMIFSYVSAQIVDPVSWTFEKRDIGNNKLEVIFKANIESGWHLYATNLPQGGPLPTTITYTTLDGVEVDGDLISDKRPTETYEPLFELVLGWYEKDVAFIQQFNITSPGYKVEGTLRFMACNGSACLPPTSIPFSLSSVSEEPKPTINKSKTLPLNNDLHSESDGWEPVIEELEEFDNGSSYPSSLLYIFIAGFIGGLLALLTPCVWPLIPMTVSVFMKQSGSRRKTVVKALLYGLAIIMIYVALGLVITLFFGASALNDLSTNAWFNIFFFLLLVLFAASFFGAFDLTIPASWTTRVDAKADAATGFVSIFLTAFTLSLVSFSCTGPIIGTLLVEAASTGMLLGPAVGMFAFALALAIPFVLFALFPTMIKSLPRSGGWLNNVKVVLAFIELALALKFLSVADLAYGWGILPRETFLSLWIVIFFLLGLYLLGVINFKHDSKPQYISVPRLFFAMISLAFSVYMLPGLWGAPLKAISAFAPPISTQDFDLYSGEDKVAFADYDDALIYAKQHNKPLFVDFTGYGCVNCRKMEAAVFTDNEVKDILDKEYLFVTLTVDDKTLLPQPVKVEEYGKEITLKTVGDKWSYLQRHKFGANAQPYYILLSPDGKPLAAPYGYDEDIEKFVEFLREGLKNFNTKFLKTITD